MAKIQFDLEKKEEVTISKIRHFAMLNGVEITTKSDAIKIGLSWLDQFFEKTGPGQLQEIIKRTPKP